jgi:hypothetical protein
VRISGSNAGYTIFQGSGRVLATHSIRQFPLPFPSRASVCYITFQLESTLWDTLLPLQINARSPAGVVHDLATY